MSGIKHDQTKPRMDLLDYKHLEDMAKVLSYGAAKYSAHNWRAGLDYSRLFAACQRHLTAFWAGEDVDPETGMSHLWHASVNLMFLNCMQRDKPELDDRYKAPPAAGPIPIDRSANLFKQFLVKPVDPPDAHCGGDSKTPQYQW